MIRNMKKTFLFLLMISSFYCFAQEGKITEKINPKVEQLLQQKKELDQANPIIPGFRVQLYFGSNRAEATELKTKFQGLYPEIESYLLYQQPYFKLRVGDFRTRLEAQQLQKLIQKDFPSVFIVNDDIAFPK